MLQFKRSSTVTIQTTSQAYETGEGEWTATVPDSGFPVLSLWDADSSLYLSDVAMTTTEWFAIYIFDLLIPPAAALGWWRGVITNKIDDKRSKEEIGFEVIQ